MKKLTLNFPEEIDYHQTEYSNLVTDKIEDSISVKAMRTTLINKGFNDPIVGFEKLSELENHLFKKISSINDLDEIKDEELVDIFHKIQVWGGKMGKQIYIKRGGFNENFDIDVYRKLVSKCLNLEKHRLLDWVKSVSDWIFECHEGLYGFNTSFSTKHVRFWMYKQFKENSLPILDTVIRDGFNRIQGNKLSLSKESLEFYYKQMIVKSKKENISLIKLERLLFNYFR
ncbi:hypothetical protein N9Q97_04155 [Flavobacteriaceae bacterium]|nr:hypothetical protein [Flavobacteriaceae bacterium]|tara:strand:- start:123 stop:809 length:687 start_codon:yes stop_codon:yes gene_type:complete